MKTLRMLKTRFSGKELLLGILGIWVMFFVVYFGLMSGHSMFTTLGMAITGILMAYVIAIQ